MRVSIRHLLPLLCAPLLLSSPVFSWQVLKPSRDNFFREVLYAKATSVTPLYDDYTKGSYHVDKLDVFKGLPEMAQKEGLKLRGLIVIGPGGPLWAYSVVAFLDEGEMIRVNSLTMPHARITYKSTGTITLKRYDEMLSGLLKTNVLATDLPPKGKCDTWLSQAIFTYAAIAVNDDSKGLSFFKGFSTVKAERCTLTLKNEGKFTQTQEPYSYDAVLPVADLKSSSSKLFQYVTDFPNINKAYGTWNLRLSTKSGRNTMYMNSNNPKPGDFRGHLVTSNSKIKRTLSGSRKGYSGSSNFVRVGRDSASCPVRTVSNGKNRTRNQAASHRELGWFRSCVRAGYPRR